MSVKGVKQLQVVAVKAAGDGAPTPVQMAGINQYTLKELHPEDVYVRSVYLAHNAIDRDQEVFDDALLDDFARTLPGKGFFVKHPMGWDGESGPGEGLWFEAKVLSMPIEDARALLGEDIVFPPGTTEAKLLEASRYMLRLDYDIANRKLIDKMDAGIAGHHSIGFGAKGRTPIVDEFGNTVAQRLMGPGEAREASVVWLGAQPGARAFKDAGTQSLFTEFEEETTDMAMNEAEQKAFNDAKAAAQTAQDKLRDLTLAHDAIIKAAGDGADEKSVITLIGSGMAYRKALVADMLRLERLQGVVGDSEDDAKAAGVIYAGMSTDTLKARVEALGKQYKGTSQIDGSDPNVSDTEQDDGKKGLRDKSVTAKALEQDKAA